MSVGRLAGQEMNKFFGHGVDMGSIGNMGMRAQSATNIADTKAESFLESSQIKADASVEATKLISEAQAKLGSAQSQASGMSGLMGGIAGGIGNMSFGGGGGSTIGAVGTKGSDMASFGYTPAQDKAFHSGVGIDYGYL